MEAIFQRVAINNMQMKGVAAATAKQLLMNAFAHLNLVGDIEVSENTDTVLVKGDLKKYDIDLSEFKPGIGGRIYELISPYDIQYELSKCLSKKVSMKEINKSVRIDSAAKVGDRYEQVYGW